MTIENRDLPVGTKLVGTHKKTSYACEVVEIPEGGTRFQLEDGRLFNSPSSAGKAVMNGVACNGWRFWSRADEAGAANDSPAKPTKAKVTAKPNGVKKMQQIKMLRSQKDTPEGRTHWFCSACMKGFFRPTGEEPATCDQGHPWIADDDLAC